MKNHKRMIVLAAAAAAVLLLAYWWGGAAPQLHGWKVQSETPARTEAPAASHVPAPAEPQEETPEAVPAPGQEEPSPAQAAEPGPEPAESAAPLPDSDSEAAVAETAPPPPPVQATTAPAPAEASPEPEPAAASGPPPMESQEETGDSERALTCTLTVRCDTLLGNLERMEPGKAAVVPEDGVLLPEQTVTFYEGESVFQLLSREMKRNRIHLEYVNVPVHHSAYIEGIGNIYEFDCGELSGWMYQVNGWFPNYGCSRYRLQEGDRVAWVYTCDLGADVGGAYSPKNGM